jgi:hypothetical protein
MLNRLRDVHQGIVPRHELALPLNFSGQEIEAFVQGCKHCQDRLPSNSLMLKPDENEKNAWFFKVET